jgi:predicted Rossmann fold flavoprotein
MKSNQSNSDCSQQTEIGSAKMVAGESAIYDVIVIGGGAAGMFAAAAASNRGLKTLLLERNDRLGKKLRITGKGRCNLTNCCTANEVLENIPTGSKFLNSALFKFSPQDTIAFFEKIGVPLETQRGGRVFPKSENANEVVDALSRHVSVSGVIVKKGRAKEVLPKSDFLEVALFSKEKISCKSVILATGGKSYPLTGSTGDGYDIAQKLGHTITALSPSLVPLEAEPEVCVKMQGLALKNIRLKAFDGGKKPIFEDIGELLFTHYGISGPLTLSASAHMRHFEQKNYFVQLDFKPGLDEKKLDNRLLRDFEKYANRNFINALDDLFPKTMIPVIVDKSAIPGETKVNSISRAQRLGLVEIIKKFRLDITGSGPFDEAVVTSGGVALNEINPKTMESKIIKGLYFAGEIIDADGYTGGFNLQIAWSTGYAAGLSVQG